MKRIAIALLASLLLAAAVFLLLRDPTPTLPDDSGAAIDRTPAAIPSTPERTPASRPRASESPTPSWLAASMHTGTDKKTSPPATDVGRTDAKEARRNAVMEKLGKLQSQRDVDAREVAAVIAELEAVNGSPVMNGLRLDVLRDNILVADQMQTATKELQHLQSSIGNASERTQRIESKIAELAALRTRLRADIMEPSARTDRP
jgi:hypothetical protein